MRLICQPVSQSVTAVTQELLQGLFKICLITENNIIRKLTKPIMKKIFVSTRNGKTWGHSSKVAVSIFSIVFI